MVSFFFKRLALGLLTVFLVSIVVFGATQVLPGDPARAILGQSATPERIAALHSQLNLDRPVVEQYISWASNAVTGDFGKSVTSGTPVMEMIGSRLANSGFLVLVSALLGVSIAVLAGIWSAVFRDRAIDHLLTLVSLVLIALPEFIVGIALILLFATGLTLFPAVSFLPAGATAWSAPSAVVLPVIALVLGVIPYVALTTRGAMIEALESPYVEMARLKGLSERTVVWSHAARNVVAPTVQVVALQLLWLAGGVVAVEYVFQFPGIGVMLVDAVQGRDAPVVQAISVILAGFYVLINILADFATILATPRLRTKPGLSVVDRPTEVVA